MKKAFVHLSEDGLTFRRIEAASAVVIIDDGSEELEVVALATTRENTCRHLESALQHIRPRISEKQLHQVQRATNWKGRIMQS